MPRELPDPIGAFFRWLHIRVTTRNRLAAHTGTDPDDWERDDFTNHVYEGELADGEPTWRIVREYGFWSVTREVGWYTQIGEADDDDDLFDLMRAMDAADRALEQSFDDARAARWKAEREAWLAKQEAPDAA